MRKSYIAPILECRSFAAESIITASGETDITAVDNVQNSLRQKLGNDILSDTYIISWEDMSE